MKMFFVVFKTLNMFSHLFMQNQKLINVLEMEFIKFRQ